MTCQGHDITHTTCGHTVIHHGQDAEEDVLEFTAAALRAVVYEYWKQLSDKKRTDHIDVS